MSGHEAEDGLFPLVLNLSETRTGASRSGRVNDGRYVDHASGDEPTIVVYSRNCLPFSVCGFNQKGLKGSHTA